MPTFVDQRRTVQVLTGVAVVYGLLLIASLWVEWQQLGHLHALTQQGQRRLADLADVGGRIPVYFATLVCYGALIAAFGVWVVRAGRNLGARGILDTRETDATRLLWFFVPVLHLYRPLESMTELWRGSAVTDPGRWREHAVPAFFFVWWALWLASNGLGNSALYVTSSANSLADLARASELEIGWAALRLACLPLFLMVVRGVERAQQRNRPGRT